VNDEPQNNHTYEPGTKLENGFELARGRRSATHVKTRPAFLAQFLEFSI
jgi:hypothetical protein